MSAKATFDYKARDATGQLVCGSMVADSADEVGARLRAAGKFLLSVEAATAQVLDAGQVRLDSMARRVKRDDVIAFCQQLSVMLETGVPLTEALESFTCQAPSPAFRRVLERLRSDVTGGEPISKAMARWPSVFPTMMVSLMKASEASGTMAEMLGLIGDYLAKERRTAKQIKGALSYPMVMLGAGVALTVFLMLVILPKFAKIYEMRKATLPLPTRVLMGVSEFATTHYFYYVPALVVGGMGMAAWFGSRPGRRFVDTLRLTIPGLSSMYKQLYVTRAARTMGTLLAAGVNLLDIIEICRGVTSNVRFDRLWSDVEARVRDGGQISDAMAVSPWVSRNVASMVAAGERSGRLPEVMHRIATFSEEELDHAVKRVTAYIEPIMILGLGAIVGTVAMALLLPVFNMGTVMSGGG